MLRHVVFVLAILRATYAQSEILQNPDFEEPFNNDWIGVGCDLERTNEDAFQGQWSGRVTNRQADWGAVSQFVSLSAGSDYYFTGWVKLLNYNGGTMGHMMWCFAEINYSDGEQEYRTISTAPYIRQDRGWQQVGGDFFVGRAVDDVRVYIQFEDVEVNYLFDTASLTQVITNPNWEADADARIDQLRKQNLEITVNSGGYDPNSVKIEVYMHRHDFAFGSAIVADRISGNSGTDQRYQEVFYDNFEWAVFENAMKWRQMEWNQYEIDFDRVDNALNRLLDNDITVRGHCIMWDVDEFVADWLKPMNGDQVQAEMQRRMDYMVPRYSGDIVHWDVNNEQLHGHFFESKTGQWDLMEWMFKEANRQDPSALLMLNDFSIVSDSGYTVAMVNSVRELRNKGAPIHGMGIQSHFGGAVWPDNLMRRLDMLAEAEVPIWVTELDVNLADRNARADSYENALRVFFSRPEVEGVLIWGFWDQEHWIPNAALWEGPNIEPNAAGERWMDLVMGEWKTYLVLNPTSGEETFNSRAFQGVYGVNIKVNGETICNQHAQYDVPRGQDPSWYINVESC